MSGRVLQLVCHPDWMYRELAASSFEVKHSFGLDVPNFSYSDSWWMPQQYAVKLNRALSENGMDKIKMSAPGAFIMSDIPFAFSRRIIKTKTVQEVLDNPYAAWWKSAESKVEEFPSRWREIPELLEDIEALPRDSLVQSSDTRLDIAKEFRVFVSAGIVKTSSVYLVKEPDDTETTVYDGAFATPIELAKVEGYISEFIANFDVPSACVIDVAVLTDGTHVVLEMNPAWCSAWYNCDINAVVETIFESFNPETIGKWEYRPDQYLLEKANRHTVLPMKLNR